MTEYILTLVDTAGIQEYIFGSNNLRQNVGASALVHWATQDWVYKALVKTGSTNINNEDGEHNGKTIEGNNLDSELIYSGGGNAVILFRSMELAKEFARCLSRQVLLNAPGLQLIITHTPFEWNVGKLATTIKQAQQAAHFKKANYVYSAPLLGLGVTADCQYTGLPATHLRPETKKKPQEEKYVSSEVAAKIDCFDEANKRLHSLLSAIPEIRMYDFVYDFDDFGDKGTSSYIAVVHTDGNKMGERIDKVSAGQSDRDYINAIKAFSESIERAAQTSLQVTVKQLIKSIKPENGKIGGVVSIPELPEPDGSLKKHLPLRPIVFGGDDVTFVCDGRLGLALTAFYLKTLLDKTKERLLQDGKPLYSRAGIAVVKSHYPFARAYAMTEELAYSAKTFIDKRDICAMDWHFAVTGAVLGLDEIRERQYKAETGYLTMRPVCVGTCDGEWHSWENFARILQEFDEKWADKRNKLKALRDPLRGGKGAVQQFITAYELPKLPKIAGDSGSELGWIGDRCTCFDAIETLDLYVPLDGGAK